MKHKSDFGSGSMMNRLIAMVFMSIVAATAAEASQEFLLTFTKFKLEYENEVDPGSIVISGHREKSGKFHDLKVSLRGKEIGVPESILVLIPPSTNGIRISGEEGYDSLGGYTVYIVFSTAFSREATPPKRTTIAVSADGNSKIIQYR